MYRGESGGHCEVFNRYTKKTGCSLQTLLATQLQRYLTVHVRFDLVHYQTTTWKKIVETQNL